MKQILTVLIAETVIHEVKIEVDLEETISEKVYCEEPGNETAKMIRNKAIDEIANNDINEYAVYSCFDPEFQVIHVK